MTGYNHWLDRVFAQTGQQGDQLSFGASRGKLFDEMGHSNRLGPGGRRHAPILASRPIGDGRQGRAGRESRPIELPAIPNRSLPALTSALAAPNSTAAIAFVEPKSGLPLEVTETELRAPDGSAYPIVRGIPRFVPDEDYAASFGLEWTEHAQTQLDSRSGTTISRDRLEHALGASLNSLAGKTVLEPGCGSGRFTEHLAAAGAQVFAFDLSVAVDAAKTNLHGRRNVRFAQADIRTPPFPRGSFDYVICLGVLQHTPSTAQSLRSLWELVKPGGTLVVDHYVWSLSRLTQLDPLYRFAIKRMAPESAKSVTDTLTRIFFPLHWSVRGGRVLQAVLSRVSPLYTYMHAFPELSREQHYEWARLDAYDHLRDRYKRLVTVGQFRAMLQELQAASLAVSAGGNGVEARATKAA